MIYELKNECLSVKFSDIGAEIVSVKSKDGYEYIWQGDEKYWTGQCPLMFPICGRLFEGKYLYEGRQYEMGCHGFARRMDFSVKEIADDRIRFVLTDNCTTRSQYPFSFILTVEYGLCGNRLTGNITVENGGEETLPFTVGLHPGFNLPLGQGDFEDCYIEFSEPCSPDKILLSDTCFVTGRREAFKLERRKRLYLSHGLFDNDAIFLSRVSDEVTLGSDSGNRNISFGFGGFPYMGLWHAPKTDAPYVCIEPWCGLPSYDGIIDDLDKKSDFFRIEAGESKGFNYSLTFN